MNTKTIENWLIIDWKNSKTRTRSTEPTATDLGTNEVVAPISIDVVIPEVEVDELTARVEVPKPRVEETELADIDADGVTDWQDIADEILETEFGDSFHWSWENWRGERDRYVLRILEQSPGRPSVDEVREYCDEVVQERVRELEA